MQKKIKDDSISRQEAKLKVARVIWEDGDSCYDFIDKCIDCLDAVPSVQSEQVKMIKEIRKWINSGNRVYPI